MRLGNIELSVPVFLAPMAGITDMPFRVLCRRMGCGMTVSEMVSSQGIKYRNEKTMKMLQLDVGEHPTAIQLFGNNPVDLAAASKVVEEIGADGVDFNMGCPVQKIVANGEGSALMKTPLLAYDILSAMVKAVQIPVTVKMRIGWDEDHLNGVECAKAAEAAGVSAIAVHGRTRVQFYEGRADWGRIGEIKAAVRIPVIGNGDIFSLADAQKMLAETGVDGITVGRGADGNPWIFRELAAYYRGEDIPRSPSYDERLDLALEHLNMLVDYKGEATAVKEFRRHIGCYIKGFPGAAAQRARFYPITTRANFVEEVERYRAQVAEYKE
ncbi:MAG: tRNA dihydrouridine synthase DusB [Acidaminococcaceae bacterium]|nr:tRNA dihydrouridine synthase DusB [Acidaminococcaceae bacterium]